MKKFLQLRKKIDKTDKAIINLIAKRYGLAKKIGKYKKINSLGIKDSIREKWLSNYHRSISVKLKLNPQAIHKIFSIIIKQSKRIQNKRQRL